MADETRTIVEGTAGQTQAPLGAQPPAQVPAQTGAPAPSGAGEVLPEGMRATGDGKGIQVLSTTAYKRLKDDARERGRKEAVSELVKTLGFGSVDDVKEALQAKAQPPQDTRADARSQGKGKEAAKDDQGAPATQQQSKSYRSLVRERDKLANEAEELRRQVQKMNAQTKKMREDVDRKDAEMTLREAAIRAGIKDVGYALHLVQTEMGGKPDAELEKFDERVFFEKTLKESHPYLYGEVTRPANTGTGANAAPPAPKAGDAAQATATNGKIDARGMNQKEFTELMQRRGLNPGM